MGKVSKHILERLVKEVKAKTGLNQWKNTQEALSWFETLRNRRGVRFLQFDIEAFYPSITKVLLLKALSFAKEHTYVADLSVDIIMHCRKGVLWYKSEAWVKKEEPDFDVTMGSFDGAECAELVGLYLLYLVTEIHHILPKGDLGLYRDDGVAVTEGGGPTAERVRKELIKVMKLEGLNITGDCNLVSINFLDVTMSLNPHEHKPFMKANTKLEYLDTKSNHPPVILKNIATGVEQRLRNISSSKKCFNEDIKSYQDALKNAGHKHELRYETDLPDNVETVISEDSGDFGACGTVPNEYERPSQPTRTRQKKTRVRKNIIYFNPPYNAEVQTNVGRLFLNLVQKHVGRNIEEIIIKNNVKVSYSCGRNMVCPHLGAIT